MTPDDLVGRQAPQRLSADTVGLLGPGALVGVAARWLGWCLGFHRWLAAVRAEQVVELAVLVQASDVLRCHGAELVARYRYVIQIAVLPQQGHGGGVHAVYVFGADGVHRPTATAGFCSAGSAPCSQNLSTSTTTCSPRKSPVP